ncbi:sugar ABC transporter ATP-binding protein [Streptomyces sp. MnatMP-M17]|uniref:sugar ABC transporter ATP-binding protein n=1 Tax=unclassified Streptomyces TaxID=2593676 RepID=UPI00081EB8DC|nr:sugar ABC transporter ATP-binding protein [Streptomyces sp. MnatMP-M17]MYZ34227.1 ATP-binding cassette domain-containing protein [Streptomyces sp. SID4917]SCF65202.1 rhamnose transport system ATP-binding protein [Streptomyces sp. MnatMP-M17]
MSSTARTALEIRGVRKAYGSTEVLHGVDLTGRAGEVLAVVGANGAGKSTLIKILAGAERMSAGELRLDGERVELRSPHDAHAHGIRTVHQELTLVPELSVTENLLMGHFPRRFGGLIDWRAAHARARELLESIGYGAIDPRTRAGRLTVARQQMVEIAKALVSEGGEPRILVLDEPSAVLAGGDLEALFTLIRRLQRRGVLIVYVSHRLAEVTELATSIVVIKDGRIVAETVPERTDENELIRLMAGRGPGRLYPTRRPDAGEPLLTVSGLHRPGEFRDISFTLRAGEITGLFGLVGSGRSELARCVFGAEPAHAGSVTASGSMSEGGPTATSGSGATPDGAQLFRSPREAIAAGLALVTEDRKRTGLVLGLTTAENIGLTTLRTTTRGPLLDTGRRRREVTAMVERLDIRPAHCAKLPVRTLSGGNQQKAVLAKWLLTGPRVLLLDEPTRGVDMATRAEIYRMLDELARAGMAVLLISSDLTEVLGATDRVLVMREGRLTAELPSDRTTEDTVLAHAIGHTA